MSTTKDGSSLVQWYRDRIGNPATDDEARGYWIFAVGVIAGALGIILSLFAAPASGVRELAIVLGMLGLVLLLAGPIIRLPLHQNATRLTYAGVVIAVVAVVWFVLAFPGNWSVETGNRGVIGLYAVGVGIIAIGGVIVPLLTSPSGESAVMAREEAEGEQRKLRSEIANLQDDLEEVEADEADLAALIRELRQSLAETEADESDMAAVVRRLRRELDSAATDQAELTEALHESRAALGDAEADEADLAAELRSLRASQGRFELYEDRGEEWRWRLRHRNGNVVATSGQGYTQRHNARKGMQSIRRNALGATVLEIGDEEELPDEDEEFEPVTEIESQATLEVYQGEDDAWRWRMVHTNGNILADSGEGYTTKGNARRAAESVRQNAGPADYLWFDPAGFETYRDKAGKWRWRLIHENGNILADSGEGYASHGNARRAVRRLRERVDELEFEVYEDNAGEYRWRLRAENDEIVADSGEGYETRSGAENAVERVEKHVPEADTLEVGMAAFEIYEDEGGEWRWRLRHRNGNILADSGEGYASRSGVRDGIESVKRNAAGADIEQ